MKILSWNCLKGINKNEKKLKIISDYAPDILILQEALETDFNECSSRCWTTNKLSTKNTLGLGIYALNDNFSLDILTPCEDFQMVQPVRVTKGNSNIEILAVWAFNGRSAGKYARKRGMIIDALEYFHERLHDTSICIGDFNNGPEINKGKSWAPAVNTLKQNMMLGVVFPGKPETLRHTGNPDYEVDHCFIGSQLKLVNPPLPLLNFDQVPSDHKPLFIEIED